MLPYQFPCERYDAKALFKKWDRVLITMSSSLLAYGSTKEKAVSRALGRVSSDDGHAVLPIAVCVCTAVARDGRPHVMSVSFPRTSGVPEQFFAFASSVARDSFMRALQVVWTSKLKTLRNLHITPPSSFHRLPRLPVRPLPPSSLLQTTALLLLLSRAQSSPPQVTA